jgi:hypothetical protein
VNRRAPRILSLPFSERGYACCGIAQTGVVEPSSGQVAPEHYNRFGERSILRTPNAKPKVYSKIHRSQRRFTPPGSGYWCEQAALADWRGATRGEAVLIDPLIDDPILLTGS